MGQAQEALSRASADFLTFFDHEVVAIDEATYQKLIDSDPVVRKHRSLLDHQRANKEYLLEEIVERALTLRSPFGASEWSDYMDELEAELRFSFDQRNMTLPEILHVTANDRSAERRAEAVGRASARGSESGGEATDGRHSGRQGRSRPCRRPMRCGASWQGSVAGR